jgi:hypothetical protein
LVVPANGIGHHPLNYYHPRSLKAERSTPGGPAFPADTKGIATRDASGQALNALAKQVPWLLGGSADLGPSRKTRLIFEAPEISAFRSRPDGISTSEYVSTPWARFSMACPFRKIRPSSPSHLLFRCKQESIVEPTVAPEHLRPDEEGRRH